jgi:hypothetical protein
MTTNPIFESRGSRSSTPGIYITVFGFVIGLTMLIISFAIPKHVGPWYNYLGALVLLFLFARWSYKRNEVTISIFKGRSANMLYIKGPTTSLEIPFTQFRYWYSYEQLSSKAGGGMLVIYFAQITGTNGEQAGFKSMRGGPGTELEGWNFFKEHLSEGPGVFHIDDIKGLGECLTKLQPPAA